MCSAVVDLFVKCMHPYVPSDVFVVDALSCQCNLSAGAWCFLDDLCLLLHREGIIDLGEE